ncbi:hypothetical protein GCM10009766_19960 [Microcella frigidaquae]
MLVSGSQRPPDPVVRAGVGRWGRRLVVAAVLVVLGAGALLAEAVPEGIPRVIASLLTLAAFGLGAASVAVITVRWRTSVRFDGESLVVRDPLGARVVPVTDRDILGRGLDSALTPTYWLFDGERRAVPISPDLDPVRLEGLAYSLGIPIVDIDDAPGFRRL